MTARCTNRFLLPALAVGATSAIFLTGCASNSVQSFRNNPTLRMDARGETHDEIENQVAVTTDSNFRAINNDLGRMFFSDRPSRLTPGPKPY